MEVGSQTAAATYAREQFNDCFDEALPLLHTHWLEISHDLDIPLDPDVDRYSELDQEGKIRIYTARVNGVLVGYVVFFLVINLHYRSSFQAHADLVYVDPARRNSTIGLRLLKFAEAELRDENVQLADHHVKLAHPALGVILERMGYEPVETIYRKRLDR